MIYEAKGTLELKYDTVVVTDRFKKKEFVLTISETNGDKTFTEHVLFQATNDKCSILDSINTGDYITVGFGVRGRAWTNKENVTKYFNNLEAWKVTKGDAPVKTENALENIIDEEEDQLPF